MDIRLRIFVAAGFIAFVIAPGAVSFLAVKAAVDHPVRSLRTV